ncbi:leucine-rich repeat-containing protein 24-like [Plodia interpunctella]|uniref:leucine-rich repeat-containing protein 24-like n=1 Tax=Plodia interpunctella TaxID=58824 RepID=UPI002368AED0|nr:leucine-rich repeat-containing protein 24-like [Plodia interpunctella]
MKVGRSLVFKLVVIHITCILLPAFTCPSGCNCKWRDGKQLVECLRKGFKAIPDSLDPQTQILEFAGNDLQVLQKEIFRKVNLLDLQKVYLQNCKLHKIDNNAFKGLSNLVELDLSNNYLTVIPCTNFEYSHNLMKLIMNNNLLTNIKSHCFEPLSFLTNLELNECKIESIERDAFSGLTHLQWLRLSGNKLSNIQGDNLFPSSLKLIELQNNAWNCNCHLRDLYAWLLNFDHAHEVEPVCSHPERLRNHTITSVYERDLACLPKVTPISMQIEMLIGSNVTLECSVKAIPEAKILWLYQGHVIPNYTNTALESRNGIYFLENGVTDKKSELYIMNLGIDDNGTYSCVAENSAGKVWANYSLKVIVKEEPVVVVVSFPQRHLVVIVTIVFLIIVLLIAIIAVILLKSKPDTTRSRKKKESGKEVALCNQILSPSRSNGTLPKSDGSPIEAQSHRVHYGVHSHREYEVNDMYQCHNIKNYVERNPDLINDAEICTEQENTALSLYKTHVTNADGFQQETTFITPLPRQVTWKDQQPNMIYGHFPHNPVNNIYQHSADVHLNPGYFLDNDGYPHDYGLPKHQFRPSIIPNYSTVGAFQTLPHNKAKVQNMVSKFANDNEFNTTSPVRPNFEGYRSTNVRRTLDGYPVSRNRQITVVNNGSMLLNEEFVPSPPEGYKMESCHAAPIETNSTSDKKGTVSLMVSVPQPIGMNYQIETRCVDVDTQTNVNVCTESCHAVNCAENALKTMPQILNAKCAADICSESPDEGYVDANDI